MAAAGDALVGPLFFWDVVRLARRGRGTALRFLYGGGLLVALAFVYSQNFPGHDLLDLSGGGEWVSLEEQARFAHTFANTLLLAQNVAVLVLAPAYLAGAVAEEKEKKTLPLLFTTALTDREIVLGKMLGRMLHVGGVLLVGLPVLSLAQLWGGVDVSVLLANFAVTALTLLSVGGISLFFSVVANTTLGALAGAYAVSIFLSLCCLFPDWHLALSPLAFPFALDYQISLAAPPGYGLITIGMVIYYAIGHGGVGLLAVAFAVSLLRPADPRPQPAEPPPLAENPPHPLPEPILYPEFADPYRPSPPVGDDPLLWKEVLHGTGREPPRLLYELALPVVVALFVGIFVWVVVGLQWLSPHGIPPGEVIAQVAGVFNVAGRVGIVIQITVVCVGVGFRAAGSVVRERARRTLDGLLTLPLPREAVLRAKWLGSVLRMRSVLYLVAAACLLGLCTGALHPLALPLFVLTVAAHLAFIASLGLWVSLVARSIAWAHFIMAVLLLLFFGGGWLIWLGVGASGGGESLGSYLLLIVLNPWRAWWDTTFPLVGSLFDDVRTLELCVLAFLAVCYLLAAAVLWQMAILRLKEERGRAA